MRRWLLCLHCLNADSSNDERSWELSVFFILFWTVNKEVIIDEHICFDIVVLREYIFHIIAVFIRFIFGKNKNICGFVGMKAVYFRQVVFYVAAVGKEYVSCIEKVAGCCWKHRTGQSRFSAARSFRNNKAVLQKRPYLKPEAQPGSSPHRPSEHRDLHNRRQYIRCRNEYPHGRHRSLYMYARHLPPLW